jgi:hypothetical protein
VTASWERDTQPAVYPSDRIYPDIQDQSDSAPLELVRHAPGQLAVHRGQQSI